MLLKSILGIYVVLCIVGIAGLVRNPLNGKELVQNSNQKSLSNWIPRVCYVFSVGFYLFFTSIEIIGVQQGRAENFDLSIALSIIMFGGFALAALAISAVFLGSCFAGLRRGKMFVLTKYVAIFHLAISSIMYLLLIGVSS
jgi:hypothetical protein